MGHPYADLLPGPRGRLLVTLAQLARPVSVRELSALAGTSPQYALDVIGGLRAAGLVEANRAGRALMVSLNAEHILAEPLLSLVSTRQRLVERLEAHLAYWPGLAGAWLFGSAARGDGDRASDVDLLVVVETDRNGAAWQEAVDQLSVQVERWTGNPTQIVEHTTPSFAALVHTDNALVATIRAEGVALVEGSKRLLRSLA